MRLTADELVGLLATFSWVINLAQDERAGLFTQARQLLKEFLGVEGDVTVVLSLPHAKVPISLGFPADSALVTI